MIRGRYCMMGMLLVLAGGCAPKRSEIRLDTAATSSAALITAVREHAALLTSVSGSGFLSFDTPENSGSASFESALRRSDSLLVTLEGPFGINVGTFFLSKERYILYNSFENTVVTGNPLHTPIRSVIPLDMTYEQIIGTFAGVFDLPADAEGLRSYTIDDGMFLLVYNCGATTCRFWIDPDYVMVTRYDITDSTGAQRMEARATSFTSMNGAAAARRISFSFPGQDRNLSIVYRSLRINEPNLDFRFTIPSSARHIDR